MSEPLISALMRISAPEEADEADDDDEEEDEAESSPDLRCLVAENSSWWQKNVPMAENNRASKNK